MSINDLGLLPRFVLILGTSEKFDLIKVLITVWSISRDYPGILIYFDFQAVVLGYGIGSGI